MADKYNILIESGSDFALPFTWKDDNGEPYNLTNAIVTANLREYAEAYDYFEFTCTHNGTGGRITITLPHETTSQIPFTYGVYDVKVELPDGTIKYPLSGDARIRAGITKSNDGAILFVVGVTSPDYLPESGSVSRLYYDYQNRVIYRWNGQNYVSAFYGGISDIQFKAHVDDFTDAYTIFYDNGKEFNYYVTAKGIQSIEKISSEGDISTGIVDTYRITFNKGDHVDYQIRNGRTDVETNIVTSYDAQTETLSISYTVVNGGE